MESYQQDFLDHALATLPGEPWLVGVAAAGSLATGTMDAFSDIDLVLVVEPEVHGDIMSSREAIAARLGPLLSAFTGEHVGQPRLLLCLYGPPLLHVDFYFESLFDVVKRTDELVVLWERDDRLSILLADRPVVVAATDPQWFEDRFWVWVHKAAGKIGRGELFESIEYLAFLRSRVLGPLVLRAVDQPQIGIRRIEQIAPSVTGALEATLASHNADACLAALRASIELYRQLRPSEVQYRLDAERAVIEYLTELESGLKRSEA